MTEYWVEEDTEPISHQDSDMLLIDYMEPIVKKIKNRIDFLLKKGNWI
jgi:hypothetical protein